jgi:hypothetical protein
MPWDGKVNSWKSWIGLSSGASWKEHYPTRALRDQARDLPADTFLVHCRRAGSLGKFYYREFQLSIEPGEDLISAFYRNHGQEWELGHRYEWTCLHRKQLEAVWSYFTK